MEKAIVKTSAEYPDLLARIPDTPDPLYYKGEWRRELFANCLAVVGSRKMTSYGKRVCEQIVGEAARAGITIVSGFMYGVDAAAHKAAVEAGGATIAVMPCGIQRVHPEYQKGLYSRILDAGGLVLSEWGDDKMPAFWTYPRRNRIVAGLSKATLVVEAGLDSGSLITAALAKEFGRTVFAVPGPITSDVSQGTAKLIREGAALVSGVDDILEFFDKKGLFAAKAEKAALADPVQQKVLDILRRESLEVDALARALGMPAAELGGMLSFMELEGIINQEGGKYYVT